MFDQVGSTAGWGTGFEQRRITRFPDEWVPVPTLPSTPLYVQVTTGKLGPRITSEWPFISGQYFLISFLQEAFLKSVSFFQSDFSFMRKDLRFRLRSFEFRRCGRSIKRIAALRRAALVRHVQVTPQDVPHRRRHENGQRLAANADLSGVGHFAENLLRRRSAYPFCGPGRSYSDAERFTEPAGNPILCRSSRKRGSDRKGSNKESD
jgi:hypothetical protein